MSRDAPPRRTHDAEAATLAASFSCALSNSGQGTAYVKPAGELDLSTAPQLAQALDSAVHAARLVVLDLAEVTFLDSAGVHVIAGATAAARTVGRKLITLRGPDHVHDIFALTGNEDGVDLYESDGWMLSETPFAKEAGDAPRFDV